MIPMVITFLLLTEAKLKEGKFRLLRCTLALSCHPHLRSWLTSSERRSDSDGNDHISGLKIAPWNVVSLDLVAPLRRWAAFLSALSLRFPCDGILVQSCVLRLSESQMAACWSRQNNNVAESSRPV